MGGIPILSQRKEKTIEKVRWDFNESRFVIWKIVRGWRFAFRDQHFSLYNF